MTELLEDLNRLANYCIEIDGNGESDKYRFDDEDLVNASHVFMTVFGNRQAHVAFKRYGLQGAVKDSGQFAEDLSALIRKHIIILLTIKRIKHNG